VRILHLLTTFSEADGAPLVADLVQAQLARSIECSVLGLGGPGPTTESLTRLGVPVYAFGGGGLSALPRWVRGVRAVVGKFAPDIVQTWLYPADLLAALVSPSIDAHRICWALGPFGAQWRQQGPLRASLVRMNARVSHRMGVSLLATSPSVAAEHLALGYSPARLRILSDPASGIGSESAGAREPLSFGTTLELASRFERAYAAILAEATGLQSR
jgi:Glycosyl transferase 4-like domain